MIAEVSTLPSYYLQEKCFSLPSYPMEFVSVWIALFEWTYRIIFGFRLTAYGVFVVEDADCQYCEYSAKTPYFVRLRSFMDRSSLF